MKAYWNRLRNWRYLDLIMLTCLVLGIVAINYIWICIETRPPHWDMARHLWTSLLYRDLALSKLLDAYYYYPPLVYTNASLYYHVLGTSIRTAILSNLTFVVILAGSTYGLGKTLWGRRAGLLAALFVLTTPMLVSQFKEFQIDAPLTAMTALALYLLIKTRGFSSRRYSVVFGLAVGLGMLTKWTFGLIIFLPLLVAVAEAGWASYKSRSLDRLANIGLAAVSAIVVCGRWYILHRRDIRADLLQNGVNAGAAEGDPVVGSLASNTWYFWNLVNYQLYLLPSILFFTGLAWLRRQDLQKNLYPLLLIAGTAIAFTLLRNKDARYILPILPAVAVIAIYWLTKLGRHWKTAVTIATSAYCVLSFLIISFGLKALPANITLSLGDQPLEIYGQHGYLIGPPTKEQWHMQDVFKEITSRKPSGAVLGYGGLDTIWFNSYDYLYYGALNGVAIQSTQPADFVAYRTVEQQASPQGFIEIKGWQLPDNSLLTLYQRQVTP